MPKIKLDDVIGAALLLFLAFVLFVYPWPSHAQSVLPEVPSCIIQDSLMIRDEGEGKAIVTYYNSVESCSNAAEVELTSPNGVSVMVYITIGGEEDDYREIIELYPITDGMMSFPPESKLLDGETQEFLITGGVS